MNMYLRKQFKKTFWSQVGFRIFAVTRFFFFWVIFFFCQPVKYCDTYVRLLEPDQISHAQSALAIKRGLTNWANVHTSKWKFYLKHSTAEFQSIQQFPLQLDIDS